MKRLVVLLTALTGLMLIFFGLSKPGSFYMPVTGRISREPGIITVLRPVSIKTLDPARAADRDSALIIYNIYEGLVKIDPITLTPVPALARSWQISDNGRKWTFHLRPGTVFHDGTDVTSETVKYNYEKLVSLKPSMAPYSLFAFGPVEKVETPDSQTVEFILKYSYAPFIYNLAMPYAAPVVSPVALKKYGNDFWRHPSGTGPYMLGEVKQDAVFLTANNRYYGGKPKNKGIIIRTIPDETRRTRMLLAGQSEIICLPAPEDEKMLTEQGMQITRVPGNDISYLGMYTNKKPFNNKAVRLAVYYALDREKIVQDTLKGSGQPATGVLPPGIEGSITKMPSKAGQDAARRLLARAGYPRGIDIELITYSGARAYCPAGGKALALAIKEQLASVGIRVNIQTRDWEEHKAAIYQKEGDAFLFGWTGDCENPENFLHMLFSSSRADSGLNATAYKNPQLDLLLAAARHEVSGEKRAELYRKAHETVLNDAPVVPLNHSMVTVAYPPSIKGLTVSGSGMIDFSRISTE